MEEGAEEPGVVDGRVKDSRTWLLLDLTQWDLVVPRLGRVELGCSSDKVGLGCSTTWHSGTWLFHDLAQRQLLVPRPTIHGTSLFHELAQGAYMVVPLPGTVGPGCFMS